MRPLFRRAMAIVVDDQVRIEHGHATGAVNAVLQVKVLRRLQRRSTTEHLVKPAHLDKEPSPSGEVGPHPENHETVPTAKASTSGDSERWQNTRSRGIFCGRK